MQNHSVLLRTIGLSISLSTLTSVALADSKTTDLFNTSYNSSARTTLAYNGKPPFRNRPQLLRQRKEQGLEQSTKKNPTQMEFSALEINDTSVDASSGKSNTRRKSGHPYHR